MGKEYIGIVIEESLDDNKILNELDIRKIHITGHENSKNRYHIYEVKVSKEEIVELSNHIIKGWYMHFWKGKDIIVVFKDKTFKFKYEHLNTWSNVLKYGRSLGLLEGQLDFPIKGL